MLRASWGLSSLVRHARFSSSLSTASTANIRSVLMGEVKTALKNKDTFTSTTLRSVLAEIQSAEKTSAGDVSPSAIVGILRKAVARRVDASNQFLKAARSDLADKEKREADLIGKFLPPLLPETEVDRLLRDIIQGLPAGMDPQKRLGAVFKLFYSKVDKNDVDPTMVKQRTQALLQ